MMARNSRESARMPKTFLVDEMLANLARWMRVFGARVVFAGDLKNPEGRGGRSLDDDELLRFALKHKMVFLTRDEALGGKAQGYVQTILFRTMELDAQLLQVLMRFKLPLSKIPSRALCAHCGGKLKRVPKASVREKVFPKVYAHNRVFWRCQKCKQLYWKGSHWQKILKKAEKISRMLSATVNNPGLKPVALSRAQMNRHGSHPAISGRAEHGLKAADSATRGCSLKSRHAAGAQGLKLRHPD